MVRLAPQGAAIGGQLRQHGADRTAVGNAEAHQRGAEQPRLALRAHFEAEGGGDLLNGADIAIDGHQHLVGHELAGDGTPRRGRDKIGRRNDRAAGAAVRPACRQAVLTAVASARVRGSGWIGKQVDDQGRKGNSTCLRRPRRLCILAVLRAVGSRSTGRVGAVGFRPAALGSLVCARRGHGGDCHRRRQDRRKSSDRLSCHQPVSFPRSQSPRKAGRQ